MFADTFRRTRIPALFALGAVSLAAISGAAMGVFALQPTAAQAAADATPTAVDLLFDGKHLANLKAQEKVVYHFKRDVSRPDLFGAAFDDDISVAVLKIDPDGTRHIEVKIFSGERAREPQVLDGVIGNPILVVFLDRSVAFYKAVAGGALPYLKDRFRTALRDRATLEPVKVKIGERTVDGTRVTVTPYLGDPSQSKMQGYEVSKFSIVVSPEAPGHFVELQARYDNTNKDAPRLEERYIADGMEVLK